jgi:antirestriction protein ArdC
MNRTDAAKLAVTGLSQLEAALKAGQSDSLRKWLELLSRFHSYSFRNCILISVQRPDATFVAGFRRWKQLGRNVRKGEKGIAILAPIAYRRQNVRTEDDTEEAPILRGFKTVHVFDVSQTEGKELPEFACVAGDPGKLIACLEQDIYRRGIELTYEELPGGTLGISTADGKITVSPGLSPAETFSVLCHELAHSILHQGDESRAERLSKTVRETEAEAVAFTVCEAFGLNSTQKSADYIGLYRGSVETLAQSLDCIQKTAAEIIAALGTAGGTCPKLAKEAA